MESSLSSLSMYTMRLYLLPEEVHHKIDSVRARFYWDELAKPKDHEGLGFIETRLMNMCMLSKWIFKLERGDRDMCCDLLRKKYLKSKHFRNRQLYNGSNNLRGPPHKLFNL
jgi:hypothetical protein